MNTTNTTNTTTVTPKPLSPTILNSTTGFARLT
jgi:hypothetical protein